jgi:hypothetical protein
MEPCTERHIDPFVLVHHLQNLVWVLIEKKATGYHKLVGRCPAAARQQSVSIPMGRRYVLVRIAATCGPWPHSPFSLSSLWLGVVPWIACGAESFCKQSLMHERECVGQEVAAKRRDCNPSDVSPQPEPHGPEVRSSRFWITALRVKTQVSDESKPLWSNL